jgi:hypothetical protein
MADADSIGGGAKFTIRGIAAKDTGVYYCIVRNLFGRDTTQTISLSLRTVPQYNPLTIQATFVDPQRAKVTIKNFLGLPFTAGTAPYVDSIGIWYETLTFPAGALSRTAANCLKLPLARLRAAGSTTDSFDTTLQFFPSIPDTCAKVYMVTSPLWRQPDTVLSTISPMQRVMVSMCSPLPLVNNLVLDVAYLRVSDSVVVSISNLVSLKRDSLLTLIVEYDVGTGTFKADTIDRISKADLPAASVNVLKKTYRNALFAGYEDSLTVRVTWRGILGNVSVPVEKRISIGRLRPVNTATLSIDSAGESVFKLHWQFTSAPDIDSARIWWGKQVVPLAASFDTALFDFVTLAKDSLHTIITGLEPTTLYGVGLQVSKDGVWSLVTASSRDTATTRSRYQASVSNTISNVTARFDTARNVIVLSWDLDTSSGIGALSNLEVGISWAIGTTPAGTTVEVGQWGKKISPTGVKGDTATIDPGKNIVFESTYHFALMMRRPGDASWAAATEASRAKVETPRPIWQVVSYFAANESEVTAFNRQVVLRKSGAGSISATDTLRAFTPASAPDGFAVVGRYGVDFVKDLRSDPFVLGLRYDPMLLGGLSADDIRMYQFSADSGWRVIEECILDTASRLVSITKRNTMSPDPFILMVDTARPVVALKGDTSTRVLPNVAIVDSVEITDNVANSTARLYYWVVSPKGIAATPPVRCAGSKSTVCVTVPADSVSAARGLRTWLVVSDGRFYDTIDISRKVYRDKSDGIVLQDTVWTPLHTTTALTDSSIESALDEFNSDGKWVYDQSRFRIFRWVDTTSRQGGLAPSVKWVEYRESNRQLFNLVPGRVIWIKTRNQTSITSLGEGTTVNLKQPSVVRLRANDWTDVALPYNFDIRIGDVIGATSSDTAVTNGLKIYTWNYQADSNFAFASLKYDAQVPFLDSGSTILESRVSGETKIGTFTIFNKSLVDVDLKLPALPAPYSKYGSETIPPAKRRAAAEWCVTISGHGPGGDVAPVYCAYRKGKGICTSPVPPGFGKQRIAITDEKQSGTYGSMVYGEIDGGGCVFPLVFGNSDTRPAVMTYSFGLRGSLPDGCKIGLYDPALQSFAALPNGFGGELTVAAQGEERRWLVAGDSAFIASWSRTVSAVVSPLRVFPNPCRGNVHLQLSLPFGDINEVRISLFNQLGRRVWAEKLTRNTLRSGLNDITLRLSRERMLGTGTYLVRVTVLDSQQKTTAVRQQRILYMP